MSSPFVGQISNVRVSRVDGSKHRDSSSEKSVSLVSIGERSKSNGGKVEVLISGKSGVSKAVGSDLSLVVSSLIVNIVSDSSESVLGENSLVSVETSRVVNSVSLVHANSKDKNGSEDQKPGDESRDDHEGSVSSRLSSVLVGSEVNQMDKEQPRQPGDDHQDKDRGVNPLKGRVVLVNLSSSDARSINETVGSGEDSGVGVESRI